MHNYNLKAFFFDFPIIKKKVFFNWRHLFAFQSNKKSYISFY